MAEAYADSPDSLTGLFERKWRALIALEHRGADDTVLAELYAVQTGFAALRNWFQLRDLDFYFALARNDRRRLVHLYYGTPFPSARARLLREFKVDASAIPEHYDVFLGPPGRARELFDVLDGSGDGTGGRLKPGHALQRLLTALLADFYCPPNTVQLHEALYPNQYYNPLSSPVRVRQLLKRLRAWLRRAHVPLVIVEREGRYSVSAARPLRVRLRLSAWPGDAALTRFMLAARPLFGKSPFGAAQAEQLTGRARPATVALLARGIAAGALERLGRGPGTRYRCLAP
jgi:hypothetical protein